MTEDEKVKRQRAANRASYEKHREERLEKNRQWRIANPERMKQYNQEWHARHPGYSAERSRKFREADPERAKLLVRKWYLDNKAKTIGTARLQRTGCTPELYQELFIQQQGLCAICGKPPGKQALHADHCHTAGTIRGLLCFNCNAALGLFGDDPNLIDKAAAYLRR